MSGDNGPRSAITIEETYTYDIDIGAQVIITPLSTGGTLKVSVPYDGALIDSTSADQELNLGALCLTEHSNDSAKVSLPLNLPLGLDSASAFKSGEEVCWTFSYTPSWPSELLIDLQSAVFDGAAFDPNENADKIVKLLFGQADTFVNDLRLRLELWVPQINSSFQPGGRGRELRTMLLEQESSIQVFLPDPGRETEISASMAALANGDGGRLLIGVRPPGDVVGISASLSSLEELLLQAALQCTPPVAFAPPELFQSEDALTVARVIIPPGRGRLHKVSGQVLRRDGTKTVRSAVPQAPGLLESGHPIGDWRALLSAGPSTNVLVLDAKGISISALELGPAICGLINAAAGNGLLVVRNLVPQQRGPLGIGGGKSVMQEVEQRLRDELAACTPQLTLPAPEFATIDNERVVVIRARVSGPTVAMYKGRGFEWTGAALRAIELRDLYDRYMDRSGQHLFRQSGTAPIALTYGELHWPVQPPPVSKLVVDMASEDARNTFASYDYQRRAVIWQDCPFSEKPGTNGYTCRLIAGLRHAFTELGDGAEVNDENILSGTLQIRLDNTLVSGLESTIEESHSIISAAPVYKRTQIVANIRVRANELFARRRRTAILHFQVPDVGLGNELSDRINDLQQICADLGFWVANPSLFPFDGAAGTQGVLLCGVRNTKFQDLDLVLGVIYRPAPLTRELQYKQRVDSKKVDVGHLDARIVLSGSGDDVGSEITRLQLGLGQLIHERLYYLRTE